MKILAIDPGLQNLAWCYSENGVVVDMNRADIFHGNPINICDTFTQITAWCDKHQEMIDRADVVAIEKQFVDSKLRLSCCLNTVQVVLQCRAYRHHMLVHAGTIKRIFGTNRGNHRENKQAAIKKATEINPTMFANQSGKLDDMCDAFLIAQYIWTQFDADFIQKFSNARVVERVATKTENGRSDTCDNTGKGGGNEKPVKYRRTDSSK